MKHKPKTSEEIDFIRNNLDKTPKEIARILGRTVGTIHIWAKQNNLSLNSEYKRMSNDEISFIRNNASKYCVSAMSVMMGRPQQTINIVAKKYGLKFARKEMKYNPTKRIHNSYFKTQSPEMAYILGFIAADGCLQDDNGTRLSIILSEKDREHLEKIVNCLSYSGELHHSSSNNACYFNIGSREIFNDLLSYGITPRKSLTLKWPDNLEEKYYPDFIRGYFDGDGCIVMHGGNGELSSPQLCFSVLGTLDFLTEMKKYINHVTKNQKGFIVFKKASNIYNLIFSGNLIPTEFGNIIYYGESLLKLERKYKRFEIWRQIRGQQFDKTFYKNLKSLEGYSYK